MKLRTRLLLTSGILLGVVVVAAVFLVQSQRRYLTEQVDDQLHAARPLVTMGPGLDGELPSRQPPPRDAPISDLYLGGIEGRNLVTLLRGQLLTDVPAIDATVAEKLAGADPISVDGQSGDSRFRVIVEGNTVTGELMVIALPLDEVDSAIRRLTWTLAAITAVIAAVLFVAVSWVERLGLRPIGWITTAAEAITAGNRAHRVRRTDPRTEAGKLATAFNVMLDERDAGEEQLRRFVADASHELRTPLTSIRGYLDLYREGGFPTPAERDDMVRRVGTEATRMHDLVEDLLLLANLDQGRPLRHDRVDVAQLLRDFELDASVVQPTRPIVVDVATSPPIETIGDALRLQQVVGALVSNAMAYTDLSTTLRLEARQGPDAVTITVADNGPGLHAADSARVFDRFYRGESSRARATGGSGLGLAIAQSIVIAHGGTILLDTAPGRGCRFTITLPDRNHVTRR